MPMMITKSLALLYIYSWRLINKQATSGFVMGNFKSTGKIAFAPYSTASLPVMSTIP